MELKDLNNLQDFIPKYQPKQNLLKFSEDDKKKSFIWALYRCHYNVDTEDVVLQTS